MNLLSANYLILRYFLTAANYEVNRRKAHLSDLTEVSLMGNGKSNEAERQELSGPGASFNGINIIAANSCL
jgi:hypothetical protein